MTSTATAEPIGYDLSGEIRALIGRRRTSQVALAQAIGISQPALNDRLTGRTDWRLKELHAIADYFGVTVVSLLGAAA